MATALHQHRDCASDAFEIDAVVRIEVLVFRRNKRLLDQRRYRRTRQEQAPLVGIFSKDRAVARMHSRGDGRLVIAQLGGVGEVFRENIDQPGDHDGSDQEQDRSRREQKTKKSCEQSHQSFPYRGEVKRPPAIKFRLPPVSPRARKPSVVLLRRLLHALTWGWTCMKHSGRNQLFHGKLL